MQENNEQVIAIFDKPETCKQCPFMILQDNNKLGFCRLSTYMLNPNKKFSENKHCLLIDYEEYHESLDINNYK